MLTKLPLHPRDGWTPDNNLHVDKAIYPCMGEMAVNKLLEEFTIVTIWRWLSVQPVRVAHPV